jgi:peptidyl-tRNA hydrolase, PTH1 family
VGEYHPHDPVGDIVNGVCFLFFVFCWCAFMDTTPITLIAGLGNPGAEYEKTRHNVGFWLVDRWAQALSTRFSPEKSFFGEVAKARFGGRQLWLLKPNTFMNRSGQSVAAVARFYKIPVEEVLVVHDELDLLPGQVRCKRGGGHAGHNGLRDIQACLGSPDFLRLRVGIGHPRRLGLQQGVADFVLHPPRQEEQPVIDRSLDRIDAVMALLLEGQISKAVTQLHRDEPTTDTQ